MQKVVSFSIQMWLLFNQITLNTLNFQDNEYPAIDRIAELMT